MLGLNSLDLNSPGPEILNSPDSGELNPSRTSGALVQGDTYREEELSRGRLALGVVREVQHEVLAGLDLQQRR